MICNLFPEPTYFFFSPDLPGLLYYSHVPATVVALTVGLFVFLNAKTFLLNRLLLVISICFSLWTFSNLILWTNIHSDLLLFVWTLYVVLFSFISIFSVYFIYVFLDKKDVSFRVKSVFTALLAPVLIFAPTYLNLRGFDITDCDAFTFEGPLYKFYYVSLAVLAMVWILILLIRRYRIASPNFRKQIILMGTGIEFFLFSFFTMVFLADYLTSIGVLQDSRLEFYGLFGMMVFMSLISFLIVRFKAFNIALIGAQALVVALVILIGSMFTFIDTLTGRILGGVTLILTGAIGIVLIRSVKAEVRQRELIQKQEQELEVINERQEGLLHFISHEIKGYLTKNEAGFAAITEGDYGTVSEPLQTMASSALVDTRRGVETVMDILDASNLKKGTVAYDKKPFNFSAAVQDTVSSLKSMAQEKGISLEYADSTGASSTINGDENKLRRHVIRNLIDNSIRYTPSGSVRVELGRIGSALRMTVTDTGVGITKEDMARLFTEGGKGADSIKVNVHSTGYGLFIAKSIVEAHGGKIWAESEGAGKGSRFIAELPAD